MLGIVSKVLETTRIDTVSKVIHIADVHIRNYKRHIEYESVFENLYSYCRSVVSSDPNTLIYLAGDIVHAKTDMSPELVAITRNFLVSLVDIAPVILIPGNHDCNLNNVNRLDALSPIVDSIQHEELFYLRETGIYHLGGIDFVHNSIFTPPEGFLTADDIPDDYTKVVLFHGAVDKAKTDQGVEMRNNRVTVNTFKGFDFGMFGDIHSFQYLDPNAKFAYAGSLIQQNFGETLEHGVVLWDMANAKSKFVRIENDWGYYTLDIDDGKFHKLPKTLSKYNRVRIRSYNTKNSDLMALISKLKTDFKIEDIRVQKFTNKLASPNVTNKVVLDDVRDIEFQNGLITSYIEANYPVSDDVTDEIRKINRRLNTQLSKTNVIRNVIWTPMKFEFSNMFSYGEDNTVDFSEMNGTYGLFAANASGKSSLLDALMFCIFDKCSRSFKASEILNNKKDWLHCKFHFKLSGKDFFIERRGTKDKKGNVKVNVDFWYEENGEITSLNGESRDGTNFAIRSYLGNYDDFIVTALSLQSNNTNFIDKQQRERKDLLAQFLDLNVFEELNTLASDEIKSVQTLIKALSRQEYSSKIADAVQKLNDNKEELLRLTTEKANLGTNLQEITDSILDLTKQVHPIDASISSIDVKDLSRRESMSLESIQRIKGHLNGIGGDIKTIKSELQTYQTQLSMIDTGSIDGRVGEYTTLLTEKAKLESELGRLDVKVTHLQSKVNTLSEHKYDPNCEFCVQNVFVQDAMTAEDELVAITAYRYELSTAINDVHIKLNVNHLKDVMGERDEFQRLDRLVSRSSQKIAELEHDKLTKESELEKLHKTIDDIGSTITRYEQNKSMIESNGVIQGAISTHERERNHIVARIKLLDIEIIETSGNVKIYEKIIDDCAKSIAELQALEKQYHAYDLYLKAVNRNGVPYELISSAIPKIQNEVNSILSQIVEFEILFETDGKSINTYIVYDDQNYWPLEMTSGMEKFISSLAIRTTLVNVSSLPRPNFIAIDEGFGVLDPDNLNSLHMFFDYLKTHFDFILTISHIDALRDIMDNIIEIKKESGFSSIRH